MNIFEMYFLIVLLCAILWPMIAIYQYKNGKGVKEFDEAVSDFKAINEDICATVGLVAGSFLVTLITIPAIFVWLVSLPVSVLIKLLRKFFSKK